MPHLPHDRAGHLPQQKVQGPSTVHRLPPPPSPLLALIASTWNQSAHLAIPAYCFCCWGRSRLTPAKKTSRRGGVPVLWPTRPSPHLLSQLPQADSTGSSTSKNCLPLHPPPPRFPWNLAVVPQLSSPFFLVSLNGKPITRVTHRTGALTLVISGNHHDQICSFRGSGLSLTHTAQFAAGLVKRLLDGFPLIDFAFTPLHKARFFIKLLHTTSCAFLRGMNGRRLLIQKHGVSAQRAKRLDSWQARRALFLGCLS